MSDHLQPYPYHHLQIVSAPVVLVVRLNQAYNYHRGGDDPTFGGGDSAVPSAGNTPLSFWELLDSNSSQNESGVFPMEAGTDLRRTPGRLSDEDLSTLELAKFGSIT